MSQLKPQQPEQRKIAANHANESSFQSTRHRRAPRDLQRSWRNPTALRVASCNAPSRPLGNTKAQPNDPK